MWNWIMDNNIFELFIALFIFGAILPFTGIVEFGKRLRAMEQDKEHLKDQ